jgi:hypothetical protein
MRVLLSDKLLPAVQDPRGNDSRNCCGVKDVFEINESFNLDEHGSLSPLDTGIWYKEVLAGVVYLNTVIRRREFRVMLLFLSPLGCKMPTRTNGDAIRVGLPYMEL